VVTDQDLDDGGIGVEVGGEAQRKAEASVSDVQDVRLLVVQAVHVQRQVVLCVERQELPERRRCRTAR